ncbi:aminoglycoside phosphotransferase family protein [Deinococcus aquaedulcis]|uniref:aminoglycoside phosphotransferase family protein n=1 Tax=Deinococcus aquaedulcis TaxID=2840455 RepID=UPI001C83BBD8|nr:aminoglycoside phosphotransferase family protein [Deinococcus aquaedulcis]
MLAEAQALLDARALLGLGAQPLSRGATCVAFTDGRRVARLALGPEARLGVQALLQRRLAAQGVPVPPVLAAGVLRGEQAYCVDILMTGDLQPPSDSGWADLGHALRVLHALPRSGHGLLTDRPDLLQGQAPDPEAGVRSRLPEAWPFGTVPLDRQPLVQADPALHAPLARRAEDLRRVAQGPTRVCHTDLHAGQLVWRGGRLAALLDFGDAACVPAAWDVASVAYFHGWVAAEQVAGAAGLPCGTDAALFGLLLAQHRAARARRREQMAQAVGFAHGCLGRLGSWAPATPALGHRLAAP